MVLAWAAFPLLLALLALGCGGLVERLAGRRLHGALLAPAGMALIIPAADFATGTDLTAELATPLVIALAIAGFVLSPGLRRRRPQAPALVAALGVFAVFAAPIVLSGDPTFAGYIKLDDTATWFNLLDHAMVHGRDVSMLAPSTYEANAAYFLDLVAYPLGSLLPLGVAAPLSGQDIAWVFQSYETVLATLLALAIYVLARPVVPRRWARAAVAFVAAQPALLFAYAMWGGVKELAGAFLLATLVALVPRIGRARDHETAAQDAEAAATPEARKTARELLAAARTALPAAIAAAALVAVLGPGAGPWLGPALVLLAGAVIVVIVRRPGDRAPAAIQALTFAVAGALLSLPTLLVVSTQVAGLGPVLDNDDLGNLVRPLDDLQIAGIWLTGEFRGDPSPAWPTDVLVAVVVAAAVAGFAWLLARRAWVPALFVAGAVLGWVGMGLAGSSPWVLAKGLAMASPGVLAAAMLAGAALAGRRGGPRVAGVALVLVIAGGVFASNVLVTRGINLAPHDRLAELEEIGEVIDGDGPTLITEPEYYAARHFLRDGDPEATAEFRRRLIPTWAGARLIRDGYADTDSLRGAAVMTYRTLVIRHSPAASRPPTGYRRVWSGRYYDVWQRPATPRERIVERLPLGDERRPPFCGLSQGSQQLSTPCVIQASAEPRCAEVLALAARAERAGARLVAVPRPRSIELPLATLALPDDWGVDRPSELIYARSAGSVVTPLEVTRGGRYDVWIAGSFGRGVKVEIDGREAGAARWSLSNRGQYVRLGTLGLARGRHVVRLAAAGPGAHPGSGEWRHAIGPVVLSPAGASEARPISVAPARARALCGRPLDWIEAVAPRRPRARPAS